jgi:hypothetical protein
MSNDWDVETKISEDLVTQVRCDLERSLGLEPRLDEHPDGEFNGDEIARVLTDARCWPSPKLTSTRGRISPLQISHEACVDPRLHSPGDVLIVVKLDRLGRNTREVLNLVHELEEKGASLRVLEPAIDTGGPMGRMVLTVLGIVAEMELGLHP